MGTLFDGGDRGAAKRVGLTRANSPSEAMGLLADPLQFMKTVIQGYQFDSS